MPSGNYQQGESGRIDQEAAEWFIKRDRGLSPAEAKTFQEWLNRDARHGARLRHHEETWTRFSPIQEHGEEAAYERQPVSVDFTGGSNSPWFGWRGLWSLAAVVAISLLGWAVFSIINSRNAVEYESRFVARAYENRILSDGSILELNENTRIKVHFTNSVRNVWLHAGEAYFHVAKDSERPFIVHAGSTSVRAVGTAFNVRYSPELVQVVVTEGRINLSQNSAETRQQKKASHFSREMDPGQVSTMRLNVPDYQPTVETLTYEEMSELLAWKPATLEFRSTPLGDVVNAFNKRNKIQITLADEELETMPIEATFRSDNVLAFTRLLELTFELRAERRSADEIILSRAH